MAEDLFTLDAETLATVENGIDTLIRQLGKNCMIVSQGEVITCPNCIYDSDAGRSSNIYNGIGDFPFENGKCPVCKGTGVLPGGGIQTEVVKLLVDWQPKPWQYVLPNSTNITMPQGVVSTKGFAADMPKIIQAKYIVVDYENAVYQTNKFRIMGEPILTGNIVKSKYFVAYWTRYQG